MVKHNSQEFFVYVGASIAQKRKELDLTQEGLAAALGLRQQVIASYETGSRRIPLPVLLRVAEALHVSIELLLPAAAPAKAKRGPVPKIQRQWEKLRTLPEDKQRIISNLIDSWTAE